MNGGYDDEPRLDEPKPLSSVKFVRNAKLDTQIEVKVLEGTTDEEMRRIRLLAFQTYKEAVESVGGLLPEIAA